MNQFIKWLEGYVLVELSGSSQERVINLCGYNGIELWNLICVKGNYHFCLQRKDVKQLVDFVRKTNCCLIMLEKHGLPYGLRRHRRRKWFAAGILISIALLYLLSLHIWEIDFDGNSYFTDEILQKTLMEEGYHIGKRKNTIVCDQLELRLREIYPEITWVSAQISGTRLYVQIRENTEILKVKEQENTPCDLIASKDGVITEMITRSGTSMVKVGDTVSSGQILVSGVVELYNDSKEKTGEHLVAADGDVLAQTMINYQDQFSLEHPIKLYTGKKQYQLTIKIFEYTFSINFKGLKKSQDNNTSFVTITSYHQLSINKQWYFPVFWQLTTLREYEKANAIYSEQQAYSLAEKKCAIFFENLLEKGVQIIEKNVRIDMMGDKCVAEGNITVIEPISCKVPIAQNTGDQEETITR